MTTAHRPTFDPARGKEAQRGEAYHQRLLPAHKTLKYRSAAQGAPNEQARRDLKAELLRSEREYYAKKEGRTLPLDEDEDVVERETLLIEGGAGEGGAKRKYSDIAAGEQGADAEEEDYEAKKRRVLAETADIDADSDASASSSESEDESEDEEAELMRELAKIKAERAETAAKEAAEQANRDEEQREKDIALGNPLLNKTADYGVKRRWDDDVVFKNQARGTEERGKEKRFVNDLLRSDFHRKFMDRLPPCTLQLARLCDGSQPPYHYRVQASGMDDDRAAPAGQYVGSQQSQEQHKLDQLQGEGAGKIRDSIVQDTEDRKESEEEERRSRAAVSAESNTAALPNIAAALDQSIHPRASPSQGPPGRHSRQKSAGLHLETNVNALLADLAARQRAPPVIHETLAQSALHISATAPAGNLPIMGSSLRSNPSASSIGSYSLSPGSANSLLPSPYLAAMADLTPLPSPLVISGGEVAPWKKARGGTPGSSRHGSIDDATPIAGRSSSFPTSPTSPNKKKKGYGSLLSAAVEASSATNASAIQTNEQTAKSQHGRNRSISEFVPEQLQNVRQRHVTFGNGDVPSREYHMQREAYLAAQRGLTIPTTQAAQTLPSPPPSNTSVAESDDPDEDADAMDEDDDASSVFQIQCGINHRKRKFREIRELGQGTFSKVMLATSERIRSKSNSSDNERGLDPAQLVAVKVIEHGPAGGADAQRIEIGLKREIEMLKSISHPSLVQLKACEYQSTRTLLVLTYCPGGDLFDLASANREVLAAPIVHRIFSELVSAVRYLHVNWIVHRDIKLENVLVNLTPDQLRNIPDPLTHPTPIVTLTDLGLSRRIPTPPESPLLTTRCGSEDYAAPEILLGQPYDGRLTDAWALGVLLYALMEGRLPFDAPPGKPERSRNTHRIARCDWIWCRFGDQGGDWDASRGEGWEGAGLCVESLLKKVRMGRKPLEDVEAMQWVQDGIQVEGGLKVRGDEVDGG
ncbi:hypothetical protein LTR95_007821 [Oleoguttula sp. CCFEE 5521]